MSFSGSNFNSDMSFEGKVTEYLLHKTDILNELDLKEVIRPKKKEVGMNEKEKEENARLLGLQKKGIDFIYTNLDEEEGYCDIKSICCDSLPTFCFELSGIDYGNNKKSQVGWFIDKNKVTDSYLLTYHRTKTGDNDYRKDKPSFDENNVAHTIALWIKKRAIVKEVNKYLKKNKCSLSLEEITDKIREDSKDIKTDTDYKTIKYIVKDGELQIISDYLINKDKKSNECADYPIYFTVSIGKLIPERPVNMVVSRKLLKKISSKEWDYMHPDELFVSEEERMKIEKRNNISLKSAGYVLLRLEKQD